MIPNSTVHSVSWADHVRTATFILGDPKAVTPSNIGAGYVLRRIIRRAVRHGRKLGIDRTFLSEPAAVVVENYAAPYPELVENRAKIMEELAREEEKFFDTLQKGEKEFEKMLPNLLRDPRKIMSGRLAFKLYDTYGFPIELTEELAAESGMTVNRPEFDEAYKKTPGAFPRRKRTGLQGRIGRPFRDYDPLPHRDAPSAQGAQARPGRPCSAERFEHYGRAHAIRFFPPGAHDEGRTRPGRGYRQRADRPGPARLPWK